MAEIDNEVLRFCDENDVQFFKLAFCDAFGQQRNISIMRPALENAFENGVSFDASAVTGFSDVANSDLFLFPDKSSLCLLPWRPSSGRVARFFCDVKYADRRPFEADSRAILRTAVSRAASKGITLGIGAESEFYLFKTDENGLPTDQPLDNAGYIAAAPQDAGENVRREICLTLSEMGMSVERSHHEEGPGQNEIDFRFSDPLSCADNVVAFKAAVSSVAARNGLYASFEPKPLPLESGNGFHINISLKSDTDTDRLRAMFLAGVLLRIPEITAFLNPAESSYKRLGAYKAPRYVTWSRGNRSALVRVPLTTDASERLELRCADNLASPYLAFALIIHSGLDGIENSLSLPSEFVGDVNSASTAKLSSLRSLPASRSEALGLMAKSELVKRVIPQSIIKSYLLNGGEEKSAKGIR